MDVSGRIFEIERFAVNDGAGIRTNIFFKGCPLRCLWCSNPESQSPDIEIMYWKSRCIGCLDCAAVCPTGALRPGKDGIERGGGCVLCGACADACSCGAMTRVGFDITAGELLAEIKKDIEFYRQTGGGVTFTGGEALCQPEFLAEAARLCRAEGISTCLETSGCAPQETLAAVSGYIDAFLYDIKCVDPEKHARFTGVESGPILENYKFLHGKKATLTARLPLIGGMNDSPEDIEGIKRFLSAYPPQRADILPYHSLGASKYERLGRKYPAENAQRPSDGKIEELRSALGSAGIAVTVGG